jgi:hypothetical protein
LAVARFAFAAVPLAAAACTSSAAAGKSPGRRTSEEIREAAASRRQVLVEDFESRPKFDYRLKFR